MIEKLIWNTIPEAWERDFEMFDSPRATTIKQVKTILQKVERCENLEKERRKRRKIRRKIPRTTIPKARSLGSIQICAKRKGMTTNGTIALKIGRIRKNLEATNKKSTTLKR